MTITVAAVYEDGVLKPEAPLNLKEKSKVTVTIEEPQPAETADDDPTGWKTADELIGFIKDGPRGPIGRDHDKYLYGDPGK
jgi:predicted DNA-binding antitoxin AbrB/MazE fold protein